MSAHTTAHKADISRVAGRGGKRRSAVANVAHSRVVTVAVTLAAISTVFGLLHFGYKYLDELAAAESGEMLTRFIEEMTGSYTGLIVLPLVIWVARRYPFRFGAWVRVVPVHLLTLVVFSASLTTLRYATRLLAFWLLGLGAYDYGILSIRFLMEFPNDTVAYTLIVGFTQAYVRLREARERELREAHLEAGLAEARLQALGAQVHPHFLFNTLNAISATIYEDPKAADEMVARLSDLLRATLRAPDRAESTVEEEIHYLDLYLDLMRARFEERLVAAIDVDAETREAFLPFLSLQPLVENAIHHGADLETNAVALELAIRRDGDVLVATVRDRGPGLETDSERQGHGVGISNTRERLRWLYGDAASLDLEAAEGGGLLVTVRLPFHTEPVAQQTREAAP